jgi:predicted PurR-regulated permease PerM
MPVFIRELEELSKQLPHLIKLYENMVYNMYVSTSFLPEIVHDKMDQLIFHIENTINHKINLLLDQTMNITDFFVFLAIIPVLVFYFLKDFSQIKTWTKTLIPNKYHARFESILKAVDDGLGGYLRGQFIISTVITLLTYLVYHFVDLKYAFILAVIMGITNIIPYFGPIIGSVPAALIALSTSIKLLIIILITNAIVQLLESSLLSPYIMGKNVKIHPIALIFTLIVGAELGGVAGMIIAVPTVTILRAVFVQLRKEKVPI